MDSVVNAPYDLVVHLAGCDDGGHNRIKMLLGEFMESVDSRYRTHLNSIYYLHPPSFWARASSWLRFNENSRTVGSIVGIVAWILP